MKVGFTGSRDGMSMAQKEQLVLLLYQFSPTEFHHGDCVGADAEAHDIVREFFPDCKIIVWPPSIEFMRAYKTGDEIRPPMPYIPRDQKIVDSAELLIGAPRVTVQEEPNSGSWYTIRYARKTGKVAHVLDR